MKLAISYARFSSPPQAKGDSEDRQESTAHTYCSRPDLNLDLDESLSMFDRGLSAYKGLHLKKGALGVFRAAVVAGKFSQAELDEKYGAGKYDGVALVFEHLNRVSRLKLRPTLDLLQNLTDAGIELHDISGGHILRKDFGDVAFELMWFAFRSSGSNEFCENLVRTLGNAWKSKREKARTQKQILTAQVPSWCGTIKDKDGKVIRIIENPENPKAFKSIRRMFALSAKCDMGSRRLIRQLEKEGFTAPDGGSWNLDFVQNTLKNRAVLGEYQPHTGDAHNRVPVGDPIPGYYPQVVTQSAYDSAQAAIAARNGNPRTGQRGGDRGGGRTNENNFLGTLLHDAIVVSEKGRPNTMYYRVEKSNGHKVNGQPKGNRPAYYTRIVVAEGFANRVQYREMVEAFLPFLENVDYKAILRKGESRAVTQAKKELDIAETALDGAQKLVANREKVCDDPEADQVMAQRKLGEAEKKLVPVEARVKELRSKLSSTRAEEEAFLNVEELIRLIKKGSLSSIEKMQLQAEIAKRVKRVDLTFSIHPKLGKRIDAEVVFVNEVHHKGIVILSDQHRAILFEKEKNERVVELTAEVHPKRKVDKETADEIHRMIAKKMTNAKIAKHFNLGEVTVSRIRRGESNQDSFREFNPGKQPQLRKSRSKYAAGKLVQV